MCIRLMLFITVGVLGAAETAVTQAVVPPLTLEQCVDIALREHPSVRATDEQVRAARARINQARALPQPTVSYDSDLQPRPFKFFDSGESYLGVSQTFEYPGRRSARVAATVREADQAAADADRVRLELRLAVTQAFDTLLLAREKLAYAEEDLALTRDFVDKTQLKHQAGDIAEVEVIRARVEAAQAARAVRAAESQVITARATLNVLLGRAGEAPLEVQGSLTRPTPPLDPGRLQALAFEARPELRRLRLEIERLGYERRQVSLTNVPDVDLGFNSHWLEGTPRTWDVTLSATVPLFWWQPRKGVVAEVEARQRAAAHELERLRQAVELEVERARLAVVTARAQIEAFEREILEPAGRVYNMLLFSFQQGEIGGIELIDARRTLALSRQAYADTLFDHNAALAALERAVGQPLGVSR